MTEDACSLPSNASQSTADDNRGYVYQSLPAGRYIRVVQLERGCNPLCPNQELRLRVKHLKIPHADDPFSGVKRILNGHYAISYAWGADPKPTPIVLNGRRAMVPESAERALRGILCAIAKARLSKSCSLWIDAVCINQLDQIEKQHQVALMADVYSYANGVLVWWGPRRGKNRSLIAVLQDRSRREGYQDEYSGKLCGLLEERWFTRLWVVQEVVLARKVYCFQGTEYISWRNFADAVLWVKERISQSDNTEYYAALLTTGVVCDLRAVQTRPPSQLFGLNIHLNAGNPHDRVYAMFGMLGLGRDGSTELSYSRPLVDVYADAIFDTMNAEKSLEMLWHAAIAQHPDATDEALPHWPSWIARLDALDAARNIKCAGMLGRSFNASKGAMPVLEKDPGPNHIRVTGVIVGEVQGAIHLAPRRKTYRAEAQLSNDVLDCVANLVEPETLRALNFQWSRRIFEDISAALPQGKNSSERDVQHDAYALAYLMLKACKTSRPPIDVTLKQILEEYAATEVPDKLHYLWYARGLDKHIQESSLIRLRDGRFSVATTSVRSGDQICIMFGQNAPLVLRRCGDAWQLRGVARIEGIMQGEYIQQLKSSDRFSQESRTFRLR